MKMQSTKIKSFDKYIKPIHENLENRFLMIIDQLDYLNRIFNNSALDQTQDDLIRIKGEYEKLSEEKEMIEGLIEYYQDKYNHLV